MRKSLLFLTLVSIGLLLNESLFSQVSTAQSGNWSDPNTWVGGSIPTSGQTAQLESGHTLTVDTNVTVAQFNYNFGGGLGNSLLQVDSTLTITGDFRFENPSLSNSTANLVVDDTILVGDDMLFLFSSALQSNLTCNITVNGRLALSDDFNFTSSSTSVTDILDFDVSSTGVFSCDAFLVDMGGSSSKFNSDISGNFTTTGNSTVELRQFNCDVNLNLLAGAKYSTSSFSATGRGGRCDMNITTAVNTLFESSTGGSILFDARSTNNNINVQISDTVRFQNWTFFARNYNDSVILDVNSGGALLSNNTGQIRSSSPGLSYIDVTIDQGGRLRTVNYMQLESSPNGTMDVTINGIYSDGVIDINYSANTSSTIVFGPNSDVTVQSMSMDLLGGSTVDLTMNGAFACYTNCAFTARSADAVDIAIGDRANLGSAWNQQTIGAASRITTTVTDTLSVNSLSCLVSGAAVAANNEIDIDNSNATLRVNSINDNFNGTLTSGNSNNSTVAYKGGSAGDSILTRTNIEYDNILIDNISGILLKGALNSSNFHGDLTIGTGGILNFGSGMDLTIQGDFVNGGTLNSQGHSFSLNGDFTNNGSYVTLTTDTLYLTGSSATAQSITGSHILQHLVLNNSSGGASIDGGSTSIQRSLTLTNGQLATNGNLIMLSNALETAALAPVTGGSISGNVTVQRLLNESASAFFYMMASPVSTTLADWNNELFMGGFPGSDNPSWGPTVYKFDNDSISSNGTYTEGYVAPSNVSDALTPGDGWFVWVGTSPKTADVVGSLNTGSTPVTLEHNTNPAAAAERGWNLVGNPYPAPVDWTAVSKTNVQGNEAYISKPDGNYWAVLNDGKHYINSGAALWVQSGVGGGSLTFDETDKVMQTDSFNFRLAQPAYTDPLHLELTYTGDTSYHDYSVLRFGGDSNSVNFDDVIGEASKVSNSYGTFPNVSSYSVPDQRKVYYNTLNPEDSSMTIPLYVWKEYPENKMETYTIDFKGIETWSNNNHCAILTDTKNSTSQKLDQVNHDYTWTTFDTVKSVHLYLDHSMPLEVAYAPATCFGSSDGSASVSSINGGNHTYVWIDENDSIIHREDNISGQSTLNNLKAGTYLVLVDNNGVCGTMGATIVIEQPEPIIADFEMSADTLWMNASTTVSFTNQSINANDYHWEFGDGNTSDETDPSHTYLGAGVYEVRLVADNDPCSDTLSKSVAVVDNVSIAEFDGRDEIKIYQTGEGTFVEFNLDVESDATVNVYDITGRKIIRTLSLDHVKENRIELNIPANMSGIYTIDVLAGNLNKTEKLYYGLR